MGLNTMQKIKDPTYIMSDKELTIKFMKSMEMHQLQLINIISLKYMQKHILHKLVNAW